MSSQAQDAYQQMLDTCKALGVTPLSREQFEDEDRRILTDMVRRRAGLDDSYQPGPWKVRPTGNTQFGVYY